MERLKEESAAAAASAAVASPPASFAGSTAASPPFLAQVQQQVRMFTLSSRGRQKFKDKVHTPSSPLTPLRFRTARSLEDGAQFCVALRNREGVLKVFRGRKQTFWAFPGTICWHRIPLTPTSASFTSEASCGPYMHTVVVTAHRLPRRQFGRVDAVITVC